MSLVAEPPRHKQHAKRIRDDSGKTRKKNRMKIGNFQKAFNDWLPVNAIDCVEL